MSVERYGSYGCMHMWSLGGGIGRASCVHTSASVHRIERN
jgi:hypothetical protein